MGLKRPPFLSLPLPTSVTASVFHSGLGFLQLEVFLKPYRLLEDSSSRKSSLSEAPGTHCPHHLAKGSLYLSYEVFRSFSYLNVSTMSKIIFSMLLATLPHSVLTVIILSGRDYSYSHFTEQESEAQRG